MFEIGSAIDLCKKIVSFLSLTNDVKTEMANKAIETSYLFGREFVMDSLIIAMLEAYRKCKNNCLTLSKTK